VDVNEIYEGLGLLKQIRCYESLLGSLRELLRLLERTLFPVVENRTVPDRRAEDRRSHDRRKSPIERRLRVGIWTDYSKLTGRSEFDPLEMSSVVGRLARFLADDNSPLRAFGFADRRTGEQVDPDFRTLEEMAFTSWRSRTEEQLIGAVYVIDDIVNALTMAYVVTSKTRRTAERRGMSRRRSADSGS
jgi:hypothetical protein